MWYKIKKDFTIVVSDKNNYLDVKKYFFLSDKLVYIDNSLNDILSLIINKKLKNNISYEIFSNVYSDPNSKLINLETLINEKYIVEIDNDLFTAVKIQIELINNEQKLIKESSLAKEEQQKQIFDLEIEKTNLLIQYNQILRKY